MNSPVALLGMTLFVVACAPVLSSGSTTPVDPRQVQPERPTVATHAGTVAPGYLEIETGVESEIHARAGTAADVILDVAEELDADLIVVGNKGMTGTRRFLLGSVPNRVAHHASCNVLIVRTC